MSLQILILNSKLLWICRFLCFYSADKKNFRFFGWPTVGPDLGWSTQGFSKGDVTFCYVFLVLKILDASSVMDLIDLPSSCLFLCFLGRTVAPGVLLPLGVRLDLSRKTSKPWEVKNVPKNFEDEIARKLTWNLVHRDFVHVEAIALVMASTDHLEKGISGVLPPRVTAGLWTIWRITSPREDCEDSIGSEDSEVFEFTQWPSWAMMKKIG